MTSNPLRPGRARGCSGGRAVTAQPGELLSTLSEDAAEELLADARARLGRDATTRAVSGRVEREVVAAAADADILVLARDGDRSHLGPHSLGPAARFVVDHAPSRLLLVWPDAPPELETIPPHPKPPPHVGSR